MSVLSLILKYLIMTDKCKVWSKRQIHPAYVAGFKPEESQRGDACEGDSGGPFVMKVRSIVVGFPLLFLSQLGTFYKFALIYQLWSHTPVMVSHPGYGLTPRLWSHIPDMVSHPGYGLTSRLWLWSHILPL